jgi:hypothetical protein
MSDLQAALDIVEAQFLAAQEAAGLAHLAYQQTGFALVREKAGRRHSFGERYETAASGAHERAGNALAAANLEVSRLSDLRARLRVAVGQQV